MDKRTKSNDLDNVQLMRRQGEYAELQKMGYKVEVPECYFLKGIRERLQGKDETKE